MAADNVITIASANINGILCSSRLCEIKARLSMFKYDVLCLQETKIDGTYTDDLLKIPDYSLFRKDRNLGGGGVAIYVRSCFNPIQLRNAADSKLELVAVKLHCHRAPITVISCYRPPKQTIADMSNFSDSLQNYVASLGHVNSRTVLCGDLNINAGAPTEFRHLKPLIDIFLFRQLVNKKTHLKRKIDLCFVGDRLPVLKWGLSGPIEHEHKLVWVNIQAAKPKPKRRKKHLVYLWKQTEWSAVNRRLAESGLLGAVLTAQSCDVAWTTLYQSILSAIDDLVPRKYTKAKLQQPLTSPEIKELIAEKIKQKKLADEGDQTAQIAFKRLRKKVSYLLKKAKRQKIAKAFANCEPGPGPFWKTVKSIKGTSHDLPPITCEDGTVLSEPKAKAEAILNHFDSNYTTAPNQYPVFESEPLPPESHCTFAFIEKELKGLNISKSTGPDRIPAVFLRNCCTVLAPALAALFNRSLKEGRVPEAWKTADVKPVPKCRPPKTPKDFRPISLLGIISKVMERFVKHLLHRFLGAISHQQYGFRSARSTADCLTNFVHNVASELETHKKVAGVFLDIRAAFDSVPHEKLLLQLKIDYDLPNYIMNWLSSYLENRKYSVFVDGEKSVQKIATSGVPQGSVLGPVLFIAYIDRIAKVNFSKGSQLYLYADDAALVKPVNSVQAEQELQNDVTKILEATASLSLNLNSSKTKYTIFGYHSQPPSLINDIFLGPERIERVETFKYLGVLVDRKLSFTEHTQMAVSRAKKVVGVTKWAFGNAAPPYVLERIYHGCVLPQFTYGMETWYPKALWARDKIERVNKHHIHLYCNNYILPYKDLLEQYNVKTRKNHSPVWLLAAKMRMKLYYKFYHGHRYTPDENIPKDSNKRRSSHGCHVELTAKTVTTGATYFYDAARIWNALPPEVPILSFTKFTKF